MEFFLLEESAPKIRSATLCFVLEVDESHTVSSGERSQIFGLSALSAKH